MPGTDATAPAALSITVVNGNLRFVRQPLMLGHYRAMAVTGTERVMDDLIGGAMSASLAMRHYPEPPGTSQVFVNTGVKNPNPLQLPRPESVVVVGLGEEGKLRAADLAHTVCQGVIAYAHRRHEREPNGPPYFELAATLIGSGGTGISAGQSACLVAKGVRDANERLASSKWPQVNELHLIELYLDRATEAWRALRAQAVATPGQFAVSDVVQTGTGALRRPLDAGYRGARYDFITAVTVEDAHGSNAVSYTLDTKRARTEVHTQATQLPLLRDLVVTASSDKKSDVRLGQTLFRLLVPAELEPYLATMTEVVIDLDGGTAGIPWEMLDTGTERGDGSGDARPWAIRAKLLRKLRTPDFRSQVVDAGSDASVLVIGEPACDDETKYPRLPGAQAEAKAIVERLEALPELGPSKVTGLVSPDPKKPGPGARQIINTLLERDWRIVHITGHGDLPEWHADTSTGQAGPRPRVADPRGVVLSNGIFLGPREIRSMRVAPDLVFVNCCHLSARDSDELLREDCHDAAGGHDRALFAASVAEALIGIGVRCVIAAGWAIDDAASRIFATTFYERLIGGSRFIDAVAAAREATWATRGNTWAAFQCYGDPDWTFRPQRADAVSEPVSPSETFADVATPAALVLALETMTVNGKFDRSVRDALPANLDYLETRFAKRWGGMGEVAEAFAAAWAERDRRRAIEWYRRALAANDGKASLRAAEQLGNLRVRVAWESVVAAQKASDGDPAASATQAAIEAARSEMKAALALLERLADDVQPSVERQSLCGSAWKRVAMLEAVAGDARAELEAIASMRDRYAKAEKLARESGDPELFYPALNCLAAELIVDGGSSDWAGFEADRVRAVRASLEAKAHDDPDFWSVSGLADLRVYDAIARHELADVRASIDDQYSDLQKRVRADWLWASVRDQIRFVLSKYAARAPERERNAGDALLTRLETFAQADRRS